MGIKGIYGEIGPGERVALSKLAIEKFEETSRPLRIAIDVSIWQFQTMAGHGGTNPAIRTFYYRLLRLLSTSIQPLFIFDGPHKPPFKRNKRTGQHGAMVPNLLTKQLLKLFGFPFYMAPGEAEAECALLQREGIVDAVLSEDVDTLMFGCGLTFRNWSSEGVRGNKAPTHVSVYDAQATKEGKAGLDREGMIVIALMSGGDYITEGIPGCGIKVACEAARAGFGKALCNIPRSDVAGLEAWRNELSHELRTNESKYFRVKHKTLKIPDDFPNKEVLGYYTHPVVSSASKLQKLKEEILWDGEVDVTGLRLFVAEAFDWIHLGGAKKFIRGLAPALLVHKLRVRGDRRDSGYNDIVWTAMNEMELVRAICGQRTHFSTDGLPELRVIYHPVDIVGLDLDAEEDDTEDYGRDGLAFVKDDDQIEIYMSDNAESRSRSVSPTKRSASVYDPTQPDKAWIPETVAKVGIPLKVEDYEESLRNPKKFLKAKAAAKKAATKHGMPKGALDRFVQISKPSSDNEKGNEDHGRHSRSSRRTPPFSQPALPPVYLAPALSRFAPSQPAPQSKVSRETRSARLSARADIDASITNIKPKSSRNTKAPLETPAPNTNPWTVSLSSLQPKPKFSKPSTQLSNSSSPPPAGFKQPAYCISSSPPIPTSSTPALQSSSSPVSLKHRHSPTPPSTNPDSESGIQAELPTSIRITRGSYTPSRDPQTPTKPRRTIDRPSPKKKISPKVCDADEELIASLKHINLKNMRDEDLLTDYMTKLATKDQETTSASPSPSSSRAKIARSPTPSLPAIPAILQSKRAKDEIIDLSLSSSSPPPIARSPPEPTRPWKPLPTKEKIYYIARDSLEGSFRLGEEHEVRDRRRAWRYSEVQVVDLTGDD